MGKNAMNNCGLILLKVGGMLLLFSITKYLFQLLLGGRIDFLIDNFWQFVCAGLIPACIAEIKGDSFWVWWFGGTFTPIVSTFMAIDIENRKECGEEAKVKKTSRYIVKGNDVYRRG